VAAAAIAVAVVVAMVVTMVVTMADLAVVVVLFRLTLPGLLSFLPCNKPFQLGDVNARWCAA
jgi:hypothetical protein